MTTDQIAYMKAERPKLYALWERLERSKWDGLWWRFCETFKSYLAFEARGREYDCPSNRVDQFATMWWEIGMLLKYYPLRPEMDMSN